MKTKRKLGSSGARAGIIALATTVALAFTGLATETSANDGQLRQLYRLAITAEACGFEITDGQADALGAAMDTEIARLALSDTAADELYSEVEGELDARGWDQVCDPDGEWAKTYTSEIARFGG